MKKITLFVTAATFISTGLFAQTGNTLKLKKGQKFAIENTISTKSSTEMQGQSMEADADVTSTYSIEVKEESADNYQLTNTITGLKLNTTQMGQQMSFDSEKKEDLDGPIGSALKDYINKPKDVVVNKSGKVIPQKKEENAEGASDVATMISKQLGDPDATGYGAAMAFDSLPANLKAGSTWTRTVDNNGIVTTTNYTVKSINGNLATLTTNGTITTDAKMEMQGMEITTKTTGKFTGEEIADITTGIIQSNTSTVDASGIIGVMGQELPTTSKVTYTTTLKMM